MKKNAFLVPLAVAVAALINSSQSATSADGSQGSSNSPDSARASKDSGSNSFSVQTTAERVDSFVLARAEDGLMFAQHESHSSHASHASHASHSSHTSGVLIA